MDAPNSHASFAGSGPFGAWVKQRRKSLDLTQEQLADRTGCSLATIAKIESGERRPSAQMAELVAACLGLPPDRRQALVELARRGPDATEPLPPIPALPAGAGMPGGHPSASSHTSRAVPTNLPAQVTSFLGREEQLAALRSLLPAVRLLTLTGPPGIGKTSLAVHTAAGVLEQFAGGVYFVPLAPVAEPEFVAHAIANTLGLKEMVDRSPVDTLVQYLAERVVLLVLDNFEHLLDASPLVAELLAACPKLKIMVTSREALHIYGEQQFPVPPLRLPDPAYVPCLRSCKPDSAGTPQTPAADSDCLVLLSEYAALSLFVERARAVRPDFALTEQNAALVAQICARLDGLPLAIELAATRINLLSPAEMLERLDKRFTLLRGGPRNLPPRHQTLWHAIEWSYELLDTAEQAAFARFAVFSGGCSLAAAESVCNAAGDLEDGVLEILQSLLDKNLVQQARGPAEETRVVMLETIRGFALHKLEEAGAAEHVRRVHAEYYLGLAEAAEPLLKGAEQSSWLDRLEHDLDNIRSVLRWAIDSDEPEIALRLAGALWRFWMIRGYLTEGRRWLSEALAVGAACQPRSRALALAAAGKLADNQGDWEGAVRLHEESLSIWRALGEQAEVARTLSYLASALDRLREHDRADELFAESFEIRKELDDLRGMGITLHNWARVPHEQGDYRRAADLYTQSLELLRRCADQFGQCASLNRLGDICRLTGDYTRARALYTESLELARRLGAREAVGADLANLAIVGTYQGDYVPARLQIAEALRIFEELGELWNMGPCFGIFAIVATGTGDPARAARLFGAVEGAGQAHGGPVEPSDRATYEPFISRAKTELGDANFEAYLIDGRQMTLEEAISYALEVNETATGGTSDS